MAAKEKKLLIVDNSADDREALESILREEFEIMQTDNGYTAIEMITKHKNELDGILLEVAMPLISGFDVLRLLKENGLDDIPVFLVTAEATKENVIRAAEFSVAEFIGKPFDGEDILRRIKSRLGVVTKCWLTVEDISETNQYITKLEAIYKLYLSNFGRDDTHYANMVALMKILLTRYGLKNPGADLSKEKIDIISKAAYFCDIGYMLVPDKLSVLSRDPDKVRAMTENHTKLGADLVRLGSSKHCEYFIQICADMCIYHHERYDGFGYPAGISGRSISVYNQMCRLVDEFDTLFSKLYGSNELQTNFILKRITQDDGLVSPDLISLLDDCKFNISDYYAKRERKSESEE